MTNRTPSNLSAPDVPKLVLKWSVLGAVIAYAVMVPLKAQGLLEAHFTWPKILLGIAAGFAIWPVMTWAAARWLAGRSASLPDAQPAPPARATDADTN